VLFTYIIYRVFILVKLVWEDYMKKLLLYLTCVVFILSSFTRFNNPGAEASDIYYNPANGHYYELISGPLTWPEIETIVAASNYQGCPGHLITITSQEEQDFVVSDLSEAVNLGYCIGAYQPPGSPEPAG
jgi:hypothetical protein